MKNKPIRVLIVDDSSFVRETLTSALAQVDLIQVVGVANDPYEASELLMQLQPDVMTLDMEMPRMHGTEFLRRLLPQWHIPVIMVSSHTARGTALAMEALTAGAVGVVFKPRHHSDAGFQDMLRELVQKIRLASHAQVPELLPREEQPLRMVKTSSAKKSSYKLIAIGASTGGPQAITSILRRLPEEMPGMVIVQHLSRGFSQFFAEGLQRETSLITREAKDGDIVQRGHIYIAPCGFQTEIQVFGSVMQLRIYSSSEVLSFHPSVDVLFRSAAQHVGSQAIGVLLTGMGQDGAAGLKLMCEAGALTIGQNEQTSVVYGMPKVAKQWGAVQRELPLHSIAPELLKLVGGAA